MSAWRQAVFLRQRRIDVIQRALSTILDEEIWSPATPRRLYVGAADASSRGWTMIVPDLANFFLDRGGAREPRLCRLARELRCPAYEVDVRDPDATALCEVDERGRLRVSGAAPPAAAAGDSGDSGDDGAHAPVTRAVGFGLIAVLDEIRDRVAALRAGRAGALADYLGAVAGFPGWTRHAEDPITAGELIYEPPRIVTTARIARIARIAPIAPITRITALPETRGATAHRSSRAAPAAHDRRGRRPRSAARPRR
jgi:hypothetical protein